MIYEEYSDKIIFICRKELYSLAFNLIKRKYKHFVMYSFMEAYGLFFNKISDDLNNYILSNSNISIKEIIEYENLSIEEEKEAFNEKRKSFKRILEKKNASYSDKFFWFIGFSKTDSFINDFIVEFGIKYVVFRDLVKSEILIDRPLYCFNKIEEEIEFVLKDIKKEENNNQGINIIINSDEHEFYLKLLAKKYSVNLKNLDINPLTNSIIYKDLLRIADKKESLIKYIKLKEFTYVNKIEYKTILEKIERFNIDSYDDKRVNLEALFSFNDKSEFKKERGFTRKFELLYGNKYYILGFNDFIKDKKNRCLLNFGIEYGFDLFFTSLKPISDIDFSFIKPFFIHESNPHLIDNSFKNHHEEKNVNINLKRSINSINVNQIEEYNLCPFRYFAKYILKLDIKDLTNEKFEQYSKSIIEKVYDSTFDFNNLNKELIEKFEFNHKEELFLKRINLDLKKLYKTLRRRRNANLYRNKIIDSKFNSFYSFKLNDKYTVEDNLDVLLIYKNIYYALINNYYNDYVCNINLIKDGIGIKLLLDILLVIKNYNLKLENIIGSFIQPLRSKNSNITKAQDFDESFLLEGLCTNNIDVLMLFDDSYINNKESFNIRNLSLKNDGSIKNSNNVFNEEKLFSMLEVVKEKIICTLDSINKGFFSPKPYKSSTLDACDRCKYKEICGYKTQL